VSSAISEVESTIVKTLIIVMLVVFAFLGSLRSVTIPIVAIPLSLIGTLAIMLAMGFTINLLTLLALGGLAGRRWLAAFVLAVAGASFSGYLTYLAIFELRAVCPYCLADAAVALGLLLVLLARRPEAGRRSRITPARLVAVGLATAVVTVVVAGASFVADSSSAGSSTYQASLARHLAASGAVFYGAYW
jgi:uncharacterized membrane protein